MDLRSFEEFKINYKGLQGLPEVDMIELEIGSLYFYKELGQSFVIQPLEDLSDKEYNRFLVNAISGPKKGSQFLIELKRDIEFTWLGRFRIYKLPHDECAYSSDRQGNMSYLLNFSDF
ncbi:MAG: hypothetical protein R2813_08700 [Flavobacteriales bacterium]